MCKNKIPSISNKKGIVFYSVGTRLKHLGVIRERSPRLDHHSPSDSIILFDLIPRLQYFVAVIRQPQSLNLQGYLIPPTTRINQYCLYTLFTRHLINHKFNIHTSRRIDLVK